MADAKSVIDIEVNDESFKAFVTAFSAFQKAMDDAKKKTEDLNKGLDGAGKKAKSAFGDSTKAIKDFANSAQDALEVVKRMSAFAFDIAKSMANAALSAAKWLSFGALASGFGLGALANSAARTRTGALQTGVTPGQFQAADLYYKQFYGSGTDQLAKIADLRQNPVGQRIFGQLGISDFENKNTFQLLQETTTALAKVAKQNPNIPEPVFKGLGISELVDLQQFRGLGGLREGYAENTAKESTSSANALEVSPKTLEAYQKFEIRLKTSEEKIGNALKNGLVGLTGPLGNLGEAVAGAIKQIVESPAFKKAILDLAEGIKNFASYLTSEKFKDDLSYVLDELQDFGDLLSDIVNKFSIFFKTTPEEEAKKEKEADKNAEILKKEFKAPPNKVDTSDNLLKAAVSPFLFSTTYRSERVTARLADKLQNLPANAVEALNTVLDKGVRTRFKISDEMAKKYGVTDKESVYQKMQVEGIMLAESFKKYHGDLRKAIIDVIEQQKESSLEQLIKEHPKNYEDYLPRGFERGARRASDLPHVNITVTDKTGGNANFSVASTPQAAGGPRP